MPQRIMVNGVGLVDFPDGWSDAQIEAKAAELSKDWQTGQKARNEHLRDVSAQPTAEESMPTWKRNIAAFVADRRTGNPVVDALPDLGAAPNRIAEGVHMLGSAPTPDNPSPNARGLNKVVSGASTIALPLLAPAAIAAPAATAGALAFGAGGGLAGQKTAEAVGMDPDQAEVVGNLTGAVAAPFGGAVGGATGSVGRAAVTAARGGPGAATALRSIADIADFPRWPALARRAADALDARNAPAAPVDAPSTPVGTAAGLETAGDAMARLTAANPGAGRPSGVSTSRIPFMSDPRGEVPVSTPSPNAGGTVVAPSRLGSGPQSLSELMDQLRGTDTLNDVSGSETPPPASTAMGDVAPRKAATPPQRLADIGQAPANNQGGRLAGLASGGLGAAPDVVPPPVNLPPSAPSITPGGNPGAPAINPYLREQALMREAPTSPVDSAGRDLGGYAATEPPSVRRSGPPAGTTERRLTPREDINAYIESDPRAIAKADEARQRFANQRTPEPAETASEPTPGARLAQLPGMLTDAQATARDTTRSAAGTKATGRASRARPVAAPTAADIQAWLTQSGETAEQAIAAVEANDGIADESKQQLLGILRSLGGGQ